MKISAKEAEEALAWIVKRQAKWKQLELDLEPPECQTEAEKLAYAFGWWKALEVNRAPHRQWVGLTEVERDELWHKTSPYYNEQHYAELIEEQLKKKNYEQ